MTFHLTHTELIGLKHGANGKSEHQEDPNDEAGSGGTVSRTPANFQGDHVGEAGTE